jgi:hypothetical protein
MNTFLEALLLFVPAPKPTYVLLDP